jgi:hypothetical protein
MKPSFEISGDVTRIVDHLQTHDGASYNELRTLVKRDVQRKERYVLTSALRILERSGRLFVTERNVGVALATNGQRATLSTTHPISKIGRVTRKAEKRQRGVNLQELTEEERLAFDIGRSVLAAIRQNTSKSLRTMLAREIEKRDGGMVAINSVLALPRHRKKEK